MTPDPATYELLVARRHARGVPARRRADAGAAALDAAGQLRDISAVLALYRPGPMGANAHNDYADRKTGRKPIVPIHPELEEPLKDILGDTYGLIVYQEQVMAIAQKLAGYTLGAADLLRRAMGKKKKEILDKEYVPFSDGMKANGYSPQAIKTLWDILVPFSDYAFNRAHTAGYGLVSFWTAYLKANYPAEYMAGAAHQRARRQGQERALPRRVPPDGHQGAAARRQRLRRRLHPARHRHPLRPGGRPQRRGQRRRVDRAQPRRRRAGSPTSPTSCARSTRSPATRRPSSRSSRPGAFDSLGHTRKGLQSIHAEAIELCMGTKRREAEGQFDLFGGMGEDDAADDGTGLFDVRIPVGEWDKTLLLAHEREMLGLYVSDHPLLGVEHIIAGAVGLLGLGDRRPRGRLADHDRRHPVQRGAQGDQEGRRLGAGHPRGPRGRGRGDVLPGELPVRSGAARRGRGRARAGARRQARGRPQDRGQRGDRPRPVGRARAGRSW